DDRSTNVHIENEVCNYPVQSTASDITLWMLIKTYEMMEGQGFYPVNVVHDSIWAEVEAENYKDIIATQKALMENVALLPFKFDVPLVVESTVGPTLSKDDQQDWLAYEPPYSGSDRALNMSEELV
ncbi:MAG TPA: DNA polymerase, partial [bacterium]|nr:DNA polymerase [bacterium]